MCVCVCVCAQALGDMLKEGGRGKEGEREGKKEGRREGKVVSKRWGD